MALTQAEMAEIKAQVKAEMEADNRKGELDRSLRQSQSSAGRLENSTRITENYGGKISPNAHMIGALLWDEMEQGLRGTALDDDGLGDGTVG